MLAAAEAGLVAAGHEDIPVLSFGGRGQDVLPVLQGHGGDALLGDLFGHLHDRVGGDSRRHICLGLVEPSLDTVGKRHLLLGQSQSREKSDE